MKRDRSARQNGVLQPRQPRRSVQWNEGNLEENDKIKAELRPVKVNEPKTPFHGPSLDEDPEEPEMSPLCLDDDQHSEQREHHEPANSLETDNHKDVRIQDVIDALPREGDRPERSESARSSRQSADSSEPESGSSKRSRNKFQQRRRAHYKMNEALQRGKELASQSLSDAALTDGEGEDGLDEEITSSLHNGPRQQPQQTSSPNNGPQPMRE